MYSLYLSILSIHNKQKTPFPHLNPRQKHKTGNRQKLEHESNHVSLSQIVQGIELGKGQQGVCVWRKRIKKGSGMKGRVDRSRGIEILIVEVLVL